MQPAIRRTPSRALATTLFAGAAALGTSGCETDSWLFNESIVGRWEHTPTVMPILDRIDIIEGDREDLVGTTEVTAEDLIPEIEDYRIAPGDMLLIEIYDLIQPNSAERFQRIVDGRGSISLPEINRVMVMDRTEDEVREQIRNILSTKEIVEDALVTVQVEEASEATFSIIGDVARPSQYRIPAPDYRVLEALTSAGGLLQSPESIYVIRQIPLSETLLRGIDAAEPDLQMNPSSNTSDGPEPTVNLDDLLNDLTEDTPAPSAFGFAAVEPNAVEPNDGASPRVSLPGEPDNANTADGSWVYVNGEWVKVVGERSNTDTPEQLVTQRIIEIPAKRLLNGDASLNIVIRPGDVIRVPEPELGTVYYSGPGAQRPGSYDLARNGSNPVTLMRMTMAVGGMNDLAIPERVDITRMVGKNRQATIRVNLRAITEGAQPDIYLKPDDLVVMGTNFWAQPLAVIRSGLRFTYGFGFLLDRNFGNDVFGPPARDNN